MKRALLILNVLIGIAVFWLILQFNQLTPGGKYYQEMNQLDATKWALVTGPNEVQELLDMHARCISVKVGCERTQYQIALLRQVAEYKYNIMRREPAALLAGFEDRLMVISSSYWGNAQNTIYFVTTYNDPTPEYLSVVTQLRQTDRALQVQFLKLIDEVAAEKRADIISRVKTTQFIFILMLVAIWAFSALLTEILVIAPNKRSADPTQANSGAPNV